jgi:hypothetical protein
MRISPLNFILPLYLGYVAFGLLQLREVKHMRLHQLAYELKVWHFAVAIAIVVVDILFRAVIADTKKLWLVEGLVIIFVGGVWQLVNIIIPTSLFN